MPTFAWLVFVVSLLGLCACSTHVPMAPDYVGPQPLPVSLRAPPADTVETLSANDGDVHARPRFVVRELSLAVAARPGGSIRFHYYDAEGEQPRPVIVLLPIFNGHGAIPHYFARHFAGRGWAAIVVERDTDPLSNLDAMEQAVQRNLADYRLVLDWVGQQPELDVHRIGLFGISLGAMDAVMLGALDQRVRALVIVMAGGDWPYLLLNTRYRRVVRTVEDMVSATGTSREELSREIGESVSTDPLALAPYVDAERVLMIVTRSDAIVPFEAQQQLRESLGLPETLYLPTGHRSSVLLFPRLRAVATDFLAERLDVAPETPVN